MIFEPNGEVYWCLCLGNENGVIGNYKSQSIFTDKITEFGNRNVFSIDKCKKCKLKYICGGGCTLGITGQDLPLFTPSCGIFNNSFFWDHLEEFV